MIKYDRKLERVSGGLVKRSRRREVSAEQRGEWEVNEKEVSGGGRKGSNERRESMNVLYPIRDIDGNSGEVMGGDVERE